MFALRHRWRPLRASSQANVQEAHKNTKEAIPEAEIDTRGVCECSQTGLCGICMMGQSSQGSCAGALSWTTPVLLVDTPTNSPCAHRCGIACAEARYHAAHRLSAGLGLGSVCVLLLRCSVSSAGACTHVHVPADACVEIRHCEKASFLVVVKGVSDQFGLE